jgi:hypothetical protein
MRTKQLMPSRTDARLARILRAGTGLEIAVFTLAAACAVWVMTRIFGNNLSSFDGEWDFLMYHLPFGIKIFSPGLIDIHPALEDLYKGNPLFLHAAIGLAWTLYPLLPINATQMVGIFVFICALPVIFIVVRRQVVIFVLLALASPLVLIHTMSGYIDLPANIFLLLVLISTFQVQRSAPRAGAWVALCLVSLAAAGASKYAVMPLALVAATTFSVVVARSPAFPVRTRVLVVFLAFAMASSWGIRNAVVLHNPIFPREVPMIGHLLPHTWQAPSGTDQRPPEFIGVPQPIVTISSIFELSVPQVDEDQVRYTIDQVGNGPGTPGFRMGGFWPPATVAGLSILGYGLWRRSLMLKELMPLATLIGVTLFLPQSHELRYFLYIPLTQAFFVAVVLRQSQHGWERVLASVLVASLAIWSWSINWIHLDKAALPLEKRALMMGVDLAALPRAPVYCGRNVGRALVFLTGPTLRENRVMWTGPGKDCPPDGFEVVGLEPF